MVECGGAGGVAETLKDILFLVLVLYNLRVGAGGVSGGQHTNHTSGNHLHLVLLQLLHLIGLGGGAGGNGGGRGNNTDARTPSPGGSGGGNAGNGRGHHKLVVLVFKQEPLTLMHSYLKLLDGLDMVQLVVKVCHPNGQYGAYAGGAWGTDVMLLVITEVVWVW